MGQKRREESPRTDSRHIHSHIHITNKLLLSISFYVVILALILSSTRILLIPRISQVTSRIFDRIFDSTTTTTLTTTSLPSTIY